MDSDDSSVQHGSESMSFRVARQVVHENPPTKVTRNGN